MNKDSSSRINRNFSSTSSVTSTSHLQHAKSKKMSARVKRVFAKREAKIEENVKTAIFIRGKKASEESIKLLKDLASIKQPNVVMFNKKHDLKPFEDATSLEFFSQKNDCSLLAMASHTKKRPNNLILGRFFDHVLLDMFEFGVTNFKSSDDFTGILGPNLGSKPAFIFQGDEFENNEKFKRFANLIIDFFRGFQLKEINLAHVEHVVICTTHEGEIIFRHYAIRLKKSGTKIPRIELEEIGPSFNLIFRRMQLGSTDQTKEATKLHSQQKKKKEKNITKNEFGKFGRVHMPRQDLNNLALKKMKGLKRNRSEKNENNNNDNNDNNNDNNNNDTNINDSNSKRIHSIDN
eukprot:TRINITY_DN363_c4_g1_i1.p1 TRINITY_DN363_c4_g1~~TRINITY_DN363_c4_g1_i1.p1  ORF type:complete len:349 (-),score=145.84 TRINITY_DN363_c4_g1_i1:67-1113(-)